MTTLAIARLLARPATSGRAAIGLPVVAFAIATALLLTTLAGAMSFFRWHDELGFTYQVLAIFASRLLNDRRPMVFEDGEQRRDFVSVHDVAGACRLALDSETAVGHVINVGSGRSISVNEIATRLSRTLGKEHLTAEITGKYRVGDIRHCFADIGLAKRVLGYRPVVELEDGIVELAGWLEQQVARDDVDRATRELEARGLTV